MSEPVYFLLHPDPPPRSPLNIVFGVRAASWPKGRDPELISMWLQPVTDWLTERFGEGWISTIEHPVWRIEEYWGPVTYAWVMDLHGGVAFQCDDHAFEFRMRWCG